MLPHHVLRSRPETRPTCATKSLPYITSCSVALIRVGLLSTVILAGYLDEQATADEYRLYRIVGPELELYSRVEWDFDSREPMSSEVEIAGLREAGLFDIRAEDMADEARRPQSRADGLLWDAPRSRWIGFAGDTSMTLVALSQDDAERTFVPLYEFEPVRESFALLHPTDDPNIFFANFMDAEMQELPTIARVEFGDGDEPVTVEMWDMSDRDPERMQAIYGRPIPRHEYRDPFWSLVSRDGRVVTVATKITTWEFGVMPPLRIQNFPDDSYSCWQVSISPNGELLAGVDSSDGCRLNVWQMPNETPIVSVPLQEPESSGWLTLNGGCG